MNIHHCYTLRNLILAAALTIGFASSALAQDVLYSLTLTARKQPTSAHSVETIATLTGSTTRGRW